MQQDLCVFHRKTAASRQDRKSTRLNSSHMSISYAVFCLKKKNFDYDMCAIFQSECACQKHTFTKMTLRFDEKTKSVFHCRFFPCIWNRYPIRFFFMGTATTEIYTFSLHDALPI